MPLLLFIQKVSEGPSAIYQCLSRRFLKEFRVPANTMLGNVPDAVSQCGFVPQAAPVVFITVSKKFAY